MVNPNKQPLASEQSRLPIPADFYKHEYFDERKFYDKSAAHSNPVQYDLDIIERLVQMHEKGILTEEEFKHLKRRVIGL